MKIIFDDKNFLPNQIAKNILDNFILGDKSIYKPSNSMSGINLSFKDGSSAMLWAYDKGNKYFINFRIFNSVFKIDITTEQGDLIWMDFMEKFGPHNYSIIEI